MPILNYTTSIDAWKTIAEIHEILAKAGATHFSITNKGIEPDAICFTIFYNKMLLNFLLPCNSDGVLKELKKGSQRQVSRARSAASGNLDMQARRVAWRILKDWIEAQCALIAVEMSTIETVFMPYLIINKTGETLGNYMLKGDGIKLLTN